ncbi:hypothetical protein RND81_06G211700 [Saponaria officinalis]|uniref:Uncharacterized protein n=1 Tax=Saponaria officinalis TaxID=3572 RepID=A0AAW1KCJ9_SAPOF
MEAKYLPPLFSFHKSRHKTADYLPTPPPKPPMNYSGNNTATPKHSDFRRKNSVALTQLESIFFTSVSSVEISSREGRGFKGRHRCSLQPLCDAVYRFKLLVCSC